MWRREIEELERRKKIAYGLGGAENVQKQHDHGKMTVRERIDALCDPGTFGERGVLAGVPSYDEHDQTRLLDLVPCPFVMGIGKIDGRRTAIHGDDFTIKGASVGRMYKSKGAYFVKMARSLRLPMVRLIEGAGRVHPRDPGDRLHRTPQLRGRVRSGPGGGHVRDPRGLGGVWVRCRPGGPLYGPRVISP